MEAANRGGRVSGFARHEGDDADQLSERTGEAGRTLSASALNSIETGKRRVDVDDLMALAAALDVHRPRC